ncbi:general stress protein [Paenibacillus xerothermodurans]|uniref:Low temperature-induced protein n=1 Tax=Paenibacillus xerothermodurans TaxID=1977292 RepID=A0A2W1NUW6_PAEXE|nr:general stress protein [Paenibacillus xerothermodurans]PZE21556.1 low temperature-induced protein [Paenibacillus xerothermodurans]
MSKQLVGVFNTELEAIRSIEQLKEQGYNADDISVIGKNQSDLDEIQNETGTKAREGVVTGATTGGVLGGLAGLTLGIIAMAIPGVGPIVAAGPIAATLTGAAVGAGTGGLVGGLMGAGIPEVEARDYERHVQEGKILVLVERSGLHDDKVINTFRSNNSLNSRSYTADGVPSADGHGPHDITPR